jgi:hypothetical protein
MDNPEKLATLGTQDTRRRQAKQNTLLCVGHHYAQTNTYKINKTWVTYKQLEVTTNRTSFGWGNRGGHHNAELRT